MKSHKIFGLLYLKNDGYPCLRFNNKQCVVKFCGLVLFCIFFLFLNVCLKIEGGINNAGVWPHQFRIQFKRKKLQKKNENKKLMYHKNSQAALF